MRIVVEAPECSGRAGLACVAEDMRFEISSPKRKWLTPLRVSEMRRRAERGTEMQPRSPRFCCCEFSPPSLIPLVGSATFFSETKIQTDPQSTRLDSRH